MLRPCTSSTAYNTDINGKDILVQDSTKSSNPFDIGAGHINPVRAFDPGLVYDMNTQDYIHFLCNNGYSQEQIQAMVTCLPVRCHEITEPEWNVNYPAITASNLQCATTVRRTLRNVGHGKTAVYFARTVSPDGVEVVVWPRVLVFTPFKEELTYYVTLKPFTVSQGRYAFGSITWSDGFQHQVRSPVVVQINTPTRAADQGTMAY